MEYKAIEVGDLSAHRILVEEVCLKAPMVDRADLMLGEEDEWVSNASGAFGVWYSSLDVQGMA
jgi:hypothetical protein